MSILIDIDSQETIDEFSIDNSKIELLKQNCDIISKYFKTNVEIGGIVKNSKSSSSKEIKQWITLFGEEAERKLAKKYIFSLCKPEFEQNLCINQSVYNEISNEKLKKEIIKKHQVHFNLLKESNGFFVALKGAKNDVVEVKTMIDLISSKINQKIPDIKQTKSNTFEERMDDDSDVIWLDPNEIFDHPSKKTDSNIRDSNRMEVESSLEKLNFEEDNNQANSRSLSKLPLLSDDSIKKTNSLKKKNNLNDPVSIKSLNEYVNMFETQEFDPKEEKSNKVKRINKLISAMPGELQAIAVNQLKAHSTRAKSIPNNNKMELNSGEILQEDKVKPETEVYEEDNNDPSLIILDESDDEKKVDNINERISLDTKSIKTKKQTVQTPLNKSQINKSAPIFQNNSNIYQTNDISNTNNFIKNFSDSNFLPINYNSNNNNNNNMNNIQNINKNSHNRNRSRDVKQLNSRNNRSKSSVNSKQMNQNFNNFNNNYKNNNGKFIRDDSNINLSSAQTQSLISNIPTTSSNTSNCSNLRFIIIDGSNVAREHGNKFGKAFSCIGIKLVVDYFLKRGHKDIKALVPRFRRGQSDTECPTLNPEILDELEKNGYLTYTPSRYVNNKLICPYDDRFILRAAEHYNAIIVSNDNYRDLMLENYEWKLLVERNLLQYTFIGDLFMIADDPFGRKGPNINEFLSNNQKSANQTKKQNQASALAPVMKHSNNNNINKNKTKSRTSQQTNEMYQNLINMFPTQDKTIKNLLTNFPNEKNLSNFCNQILNNINK